MQARMAELVQTFDARAATSTRAMILMERRWGKIEIEVDWLHLGGHESSRGKGGGDPGKVELKEHSLYGSKPTNLKCIAYLILSAADKWPLSSF